MIVQLAVACRQTLEPVRIRREDFGVRREGCHFLERAGVVGLDVAGDDDINLRGLDDGRNAGEEFILEFNLRGVDERNFFVDNQIGVVAGAARGFVAVEISQRPIDCAHPKNIFTDLNRLAVVHHLENLQKNFFNLNTGTRKKEQGTRKKLIPCPLSLAP